MFEHVFDDGWVQDTAPPSPATQAALDACTAAITDQRTAYHRVLSTVRELARSNAVTETGHRNLTRLVQEHLRVDPADARRLIHHAELLAPPDPGPLVPVARPPPPNPTCPPPPTPRPTAPSGPSTSW